MQRRRLQGTRREARRSRKAGRFEAMRGLRTAE